MLDHRIKLRHISVFLEVARLKSVNKAALALHVSQPAISKSLAELEDLLKTALFDRSRRNLALTSFGEVFLRYASASLTSLTQGIQAAAHAGTDETVTLRIGALPTVSARILPAAMAHFMQQGFNIRPRVLTGPNDFIMSQLRHGDLDLVIGRMAEPEAMAGFAFEHLYSEPVRLVVRPNHPLLSGALDLNAIGQFEMLLPTPGSVIAPIVQRFLITNGISPQNRIIETVSNAFGRSYTRTSDAVWIISEGVVFEDISDGILVALPLDTSDTKGPVGLTTRTSTETSLPVQLFAQSIRSVARDMRNDT